MDIKLIIQQPSKQKTFCKTFVQRRPNNVFDVGPALYKCYTNVLCLLGHEQIFNCISLLN